jgi:hypothetical protein
VGWGKDKPDRELGLLRLAGPKAAFASVT